MHDEAPNKRAHCSILFSGGYNNIFFATRFRFFVANSRDQPDACGAVHLIPIRVNRTTSGLLHCGVPRSLSRTQDGVEETSAAIRQGKAAWFEQMAGEKKSGQGKAGGEFVWRDFLAVTNDELPPASLRSAFSRACGGGLGGGQKGREREQPVLPSLAGRP